MLRRSSTADRDRERDSENVGERKGQSVVGCVDVQICGCADVATGKLRRNSADVKGKMRRCIVVDF